MPPGSRLGVTEVPLESQRTYAAEDDTQHRLDGLQLAFEPDHVRLGGELGHQRLGEDFRRCLWPRRMSQATLW
jgi:hypothetical protein